MINSENSELKLTQANSTGKHTSKQGAHHPEHMEISFIHIK